MISLLNEEADVCVIGSGAGGAPVATELAKAGAKVVVLEKGPWYTKKDFVHDEIEICRRDFFEPYVGKEPRLLSRDGKAPEQTRDGWLANCVGGGTVHMSGFFYRLHPEDFRMRTRYPDLPGANLQDWPISYDELAPFYDQVERDVGVSGVVGDNPWEPARSGPFAYPPLPYHPLAEVIDKAAKSLGLHCFQTPRGIISRQTGARSACQFCDFCGSYGCEHDAKSSMAVALLPGAIDTGKCEVRPHCMVFDIAVDAKGQARAVRYFDEKGAIIEQRARLVVVSASAIESARLLLNSKSPSFPDGLGNKNGLVGKNLIFSTMGKGYGQFDRKKLDPAAAGPGVHFLNRSIQDFYFLPERKGGYDKGGTLNFVQPHKNLILSAERIASRGHGWGAQWKTDFYRYHRDVKEIEFEVFGEFLPTKWSFVSTDASVKDKWGLPVAHIHLQHHAEDVKTSQLLMDHGVAVLKAAGAANTTVDAVGGTTWVLQHGTCRFGDDPKTSVLDRNCRSHQVKNLYVVDGSFMPTSGGVATTWTIMANAFRVAAHLVKSRKAGAL